MRTAFLPVGDRRPTSLIAERPAAGDPTGLGGLIPDHDDSLLVRRLMEVPIEITVAERADGDPEQPDDRRTLEPSLTRRFRAAE